MTRHSQTMPPDYFDNRYAEDPDPWQFATSEYEAAKYAATLEALPKPHYASALEIGCSIGVFTKALAARCDALIGVDTAEKALEQARERCSGGATCELSAVARSRPMACRPVST